MSSVPKAVFKVVYNGTNITEDVSRHLISLTYTDNVSGKSDEIELTLDDASAQWRNEWYPSKGDKINVKIGWPGDILNCGDFTVDEIELSGPPSTIHIRGLSTSSTGSMRTKNSKAREGKTLHQIAQEIAQKHGLTLIEGTKNVKTAAQQTDTYISNLDMIRAQLFGTKGQDFDTQSQTIAMLTGDIGQLVKDLRAAGFNDQADIVFNGANTMFHHITDTGISVYNTQLLQVRNYLVRVNGKSFTKTIPLDLSGIVLARSTQIRETDLAYLRRIAEEHGFAFTIKGNFLSFFSVYHLEEQPTVLSLRRSDLSKYSLKDKTAGVYKKAKVRHHNPKTGNAVESNVNTQPLINKDNLEFVQIIPEDTLNIRVKADNQQQADAKAKAALHKKNSKSCNGSVTLYGNTKIMAGVNFGLLDMGKFSGTYHVEKSTHKYERGGGYETEAEIKRVGAPTSKDQKLKHAAIASGNFRVQTITNRDGLKFVQIVQ